MANYKDYNNGYSLSIDLEAKPIINDKDMQEFKNKVDSLKQNLDLVVSLDTEDSYAFNNLALTKILGENNEQMAQLKNAMIEAEKLSEKRELALKAIRENESLEDGLKLDDESLQALKEIVKEIESKTDLFDNYKKLTGKDLLNKESKGYEDVEVEKAGFGKVKEEWSNLLGKEGITKVFNGKIENLLGVKGKIAMKVIGFFQNVSKKIGEFFQETFKAAIEEIEEIATYNLETSTTFNEDAWNDMINYGMSGQQSYAWENALEKVNLSGTDLADVAMYLQAMPELASTFQSYYEDYLNSYETNLELAQSYQDFQTSWEEFKTDFMQDFMEFFSKNKYTIMNILKGIMSFLEGVLDVVDNILSFMPGNTKTLSERTQAALDVLGVSSTTNNSSISTTITQKNNYTNVSNSEQNSLESMNQTALLELYKSLT